MRWYGWESRRAFTTDRRGRTSHLSKAVSVPIRDTDATVEHGGHATVVVSVAISVGRPMASTLARDGNGGCASIVATTCAVAARVHILNDCLRVGSVVRTNDGDRFGI